MSVFTGFLLGLSTLVFIGPVFFYLINASIESGLKAGFSVVFGIFLGDLICVLLAVYGVGDFLELPIIQFCFALLGGTILIFMGVKALFFNQKDVFNEGKQKRISYSQYGIKGFLINFVNTFVFAVWLGFYTYLFAKYENELDVKIALFTALLVILLTDIMKVLLAFKLRTFISPLFLKRIMKIIAVIMIFFGVRLLVFLF